MQLQGSLVNVFVQVFKFSGDFWRGPEIKPNRRHAAATWFLFSKKKCYPQSFFPLVNGSGCFWSVPAFSVKKIDTLAFCVQIKLPCTKVFVNSPSERLSLAFSWKDTPASGFSASLFRCLLPAEWVPSQPSSRHSLVHCPPPPHCPPLCSPLTYPPPLRPP